MKQAIQKPVIYDMYIPHNILVPSFFTEDSQPEPVNKIWWWFCRLRFWRYRMNYHHNFLVKKTNYMRDKDFEEDYDRPSTLADAIGSLKKIAKN